MDVNEFVEWVITSSHPDALRGFIRENIESAKKWMLEDYLNNTDNEPAFPYKKRIWSMPSVDVGANEDDLEIPEGTEIEVLDRAGETCRLCRWGEHTFWLDIEEINYERD